MIRCAEWFLNHKRWTNCPCRFDVVAIVLPDTGEPEIEHIPEAFFPRR